MVIYFKNKQSATRFVNRLNKKETKPKAKQIFEGAVLPDILERMKNDIQEIKEELKKIGNKII